MKKDIKNILNGKNLEGISSLLNVLSNADDKGEVFNMDVSKEKFSKLITEALKNGVISKEEANKYLKENLLTDEERKENFEKVKKLCEKARNPKRGKEVIVSSNKERGDIEHE